MQAHDKSRTKRKAHTIVTFSIHFWLLGSIAWISKRYFWHPVQCWLDATNRGIFLNPRRRPKSEDQEQNKGRWKALLSKLETISKIDSSSDSWLMGKLFKGSRCQLLAQISSSRSTRRHFGQQAITWMFLFKNYLFIYLFLAALGLCSCTQSISSCGKWGLLSIVVLRLLITMASLTVEHSL